MQAPLEESSIRSVRDALQELGMSRSGMERLVDGATQESWMLKSTLERLIPSYFAIGLSTKCKHVVPANSVFTLQPVSGSVKLEVSDMARWRGTRS